MQSIKDNLRSISHDLRGFVQELYLFIVASLALTFQRFEKGKGILVVLLYKQRGRMSKRLIHSGMAGITAFGALVAPIIAEEFPGNGVDPWEAQSPSSVLSASISDESYETLISQKARDKIVEYTVQPGDTVSVIAEKFGISEDTIRWQNDLKSKDSIKVGQTLEILPVTGIMHKVQKGDSVYSIAKKYDTSPQAMVDFPYNTFVNDETFELAIGQTIIVPDGVKPDETPWSPVARVRQITPDAGTVVASGSFVWPTAGTITQYYSWYHPGIDIANRAAPSILAADAGTVIVAGWPDNYGYGNRVVIDHGNGTQTRYAHLSKIYVVIGQTVNRGDTIGQMGSTGRSTGTHLHFELIRAGAKLNPLTVLK